MRVPSSIALSLALFPLSLAACDAECEHLTDCPGGLVCTADGSCVAREGPDVPGGAARSDGQAGAWGAGAAADVDTEETLPPEVVASGLGLITGEIGNVDNVSSEASVALDAVQLSLRSLDGGSFLVAISSATGTLPVLLGTPGTYTFDAATLGDVSGIACGPGYDEGAQEVEIVVGEADDAGAMELEIEIVNTQSNVRAYAVVNATPG